jgi:hypothetical protein
VKLYTRTGAASISNEQHGEFTIAKDGSVHVPDEFGAYLHRQHIGGKPAWEDEAERHARLVAEEVERRKDPATLLAAVEELQRAAATGTPEGRRDKGKQGRPGGGRR